MIPRQTLSAPPAKRTAIDPQPGVFDEDPRHRLALTDDRRSYWAELKRRHVVRVRVTYLVVAGAVAGTADVFLPGPVRLSGSSPPYSPI